MSYQLENNAPGSKVVYFDSRDAQYNQYTNAGRPFTTHALFDMKESLAVDNHLDTLVSLHAAAIPFSFYLIRENQNDTLMLSVGKASTDMQNTNVKMQFPSGNFTPSEFADEMTVLLQQKLEEMKTYLPGIWDDAVFAPKVTWLPFKDKLVWQFNTSGSNGSRQTPDIKIRFLCSAGQGSTMVRETGLEANDLQYFELTAASKIQGYPESGMDHVPGMLCPGCLDLRSSIHSVYLKTSLTNNATLDSSTGNISSILCRIPLVADPGSVIHFQGNGTHQAKTKLDSIKSVVLMLTDDRGRLLNLNGLNWQVSLQFAFVYSQRAIPPLSQQESKYITHVQDRPKLKKLMARQRKKKTGSIISQRSKSNKNAIQTRAKNIGPDGETNRNETGSESGEVDRD